MKGIKLYKKDGQLLSKEEAHNLFFAIKYSEPADEPLHLITKEVDAFGNGTHGCLNLRTGQWDYYRESEFSDIKD